MNFNGFQAEQHGSGYAVTLRLWVGAEEATEGMNNANTEFALATVARSLRAVSAISGGDVPVSAEPGITSHQPAGDAGDNDFGSVPANPGRRRRGAGKEQDENAASGVSEPQGDGAGTDADDPKPARETGRRTRRRSEPAVAVPAETAGAVKPANGRRTRKTGGTAKTEGGPISEATPAPSAKRRGPSAKKAAPSAATTSPSDVTDEDLSKAASQAATILGAPATMAIMEEFGVGFIGELKGDQRQEFLDRLKTAREEKE